MRRSDVVTTWPFVSSLLVLLVNDAWLKQAYPGVVSGKLSDFAGIAIVSLLLLSFQPLRQRLVYGLIIAGFAWWKSSLSQTAIDTLNLYLSTPIGRTVDYTDLAAFLIMPFCAIVAARPADFSLPGQSFRRIALIPLVVMTALGLMATSQMFAVREGYQIRVPPDAADFDRDEIDRIVAKVATEHGLECSRCESPADARVYSGGNMSLIYEFTGAKTLSFKVYVRSDMFRSDAPKRKREDLLRDDLKRQLAASRMDLEYVEQLGPDGTGYLP